MRTGRVKNPTRCEHAKNKKSWNCADAGNGSDHGNKYWRSDPQQ
jgi:hypothetical protein